jgi:predicted metal-dependent hydrolase
VPQLQLSFARPRKKKGGLEIDHYRELVDRLRADAAKVAEHFKLPPHELDADRPDVHDRYGVCFDDGRIRIRLIHARTGRPLRYSALIDTVVHELAHLRHMNHGPRWEALYEKMLAWCRREGIYSPQPRRSTGATPEPPRPLTQLGLFSGRR